MATQAYQAHNMIKTGFQRSFKQALSKKVESMIEKMEKDFFDEVKEGTPEKTGRAKSGWKRTAHGGINKVPYIGVLDGGRVKATHRKGMQGSKDARDGMTKPALQTIKERFNKGTYLK